MAKSNQKNGTRTRSRPGASSPPNTLSSRLRAWRDNHSLVAGQSIQRLLATPLSSAMTILVLSIAITLPAALNIAIINIAELTGQANDSVQMSLYLQKQVSDSRGQALATDIRSWEGVASTDYISPATARKSFETMAGFEEIIASLPENPLPGVISVTLSEQLLTTNSAEALRERAVKLEQVDTAKIDLAWLQKVRAIVDFGERLAAGLTLLLSIGVVLVVGNTIKLSIDNRREEIIVTKLVGATNAFVRRPFLYMGLWFGLSGAIIAIVLLTLAKFALTNSLDALSELYGSAISLKGLGLLNSLTLVLSGAMLGWLGAWLASSQHIRALEPR